MRIYKDPVEMIKEVEREVFEMGITYPSKTVQDRDVQGNDDFKTIELAGYCYAISDFQDNGLLEMLRYMKFDPIWAVHEFQERIDSLFQNPGEAYEILPLWKQYLHDGRFSYTYNERYREQLPQIIEELQKRPETRQAVLTMYDRHQDLQHRGGLARVPCSMHTQFLIRNGKLHSYYIMRSCDFLKHFAYDVTMACWLQDYIARNVGVECGSFTHFIGSLHAFHGDMKQRGIF
jgi:thymidylate synthase